MRSLKCSHVLGYQDSAYITPMTNAQRITQRAISELRFIPSRQSSSGRTSAMADRKPSMCSSCTGAEMVTPMPPLIE